MRSRADERPYLAFLHGLSLMLSSASMRLRYVPSPAISCATTGIRFSGKCAKADSPSQLPQGLARFPRSAAPWSSRRQGSEGSVFAMHSGLIIRYVGLDVSWDCL